MSQVEGFWVGFWIFGLIMKNEEFPCFEFGGKTSNTKETRLWNYEFYIDES
jgi:hypothetical protein